MSQRLESLKEEILVNNTSAEDVQAKPEPNPTAILPPDSPNTHRTTSPTLGRSPPEDRHGGTDRVSMRDPIHIGDHSKVNDSKSASKDDIMSLDISEYELQMMEMQARREELEEQSTLDFKVGLFVFFCLFYPM